MPSPTSIHAPTLHLLLAAALVLAAALPTTARAQVAADVQRAPQTQLGLGRGPINTDTSGIALKGYDPVAYQTASQAMLGLDSLTAVHDGVTYRFASAANRALFIQDPTRYTPAYGGYCAMGVVGGRKFDIDPMAFTIVGGRLYMNKDMRTRTMWMRDIPGFIGRADTNWPRALSQMGF